MIDNQLMLYYFFYRELDYNLASISQTIYAMITQYEVPGYLTQVLPAFASQPQLGSIGMNLYKELQHFTEYTRKAIEEHNYVLAKRCFRLAGKLYEQGDVVVQNAIDNVFVYAFTSFFPHEDVEKAIVKSIIPASLYALYIKQITRNDC